MISWLKKRKWELISLVLSMLLAASCGAVTYYETFENIDNLLIDEMTEGIEIYKENAPISIIAIDKKTIEELGVFNTWSRQISADIVNILNSEKETPIVIGMDLLYEEEKDSEGDLAFVKACEEAGNVCLASKMTVNSLNEGMLLDDLNVDGVPSMEPERPEEGIIYPYEAVRKVTQVGVSDNFIAESNRAVREFMLDVDVELEVKKIDSFAMILYKEYQEHAGLDNAFDFNVEEESKLLRFNYSRGFGEYKTYSFIDVLERKVDVSEFANTIVIIGDYTEENRHSVPVVLGGQMPDAGLQANMVEALLSQKVVRKFPNSTIAGIYGMLIFICYTYIFHLKGKKSILGAMLVLIVHFQLAFFLRNRYYVPIFSLWLFSLLAILLGLLVAYMRERENKKHLQKALETYVEADVVEAIVNDVAYDIKLGGEKKDIAVLFVDIRGFTSLSEILPPEEMVAILNEYFEMVAHAVMDNGGDIDKFIGDAAMALFNANKDVDDYVLQTVYAAWDILKDASKLKEDCLKKYGKEVSFGIGIQCGEAIVGNIGCECRMDYTAIGDVVNTASRLESKAKAGQILITDNVYEQVKKYVKAEPIGKLTLKGKTQEIETYQVTGISRKEGTL